MSILKSGDSILDNQADIEQHVLDYYTNLFGTENVCTNSYFISNVIPNLVTVEDNAMLTNLPIMEEVRAAVFDMNCSGAPGPDGFGGCFF